MAVNTTVGYGTTFARGNADGPPETFTDLAQMTNITPPSVTLETDDGTHFNSADGYREFIPALLDAGEVEVELNFDADGTDYSNYITDIEARAVKNYQITFPDTTTVTFAAIPTGYSKEIPMDGVMKITFTYKVTGKPVVA